jgi:hypothetical protein
VLQSLDTLGAGFQLASHDLDIRGAGNLLGEEQSGHIKEVGFELYQQMLEEAVLALKSFPNPAGLVGFISRQGTLAKIRPDHSMFLARDLPAPSKRMAAAAMLMTQLAEIAGQG